LDLHAHKGLPGLPDGFLALLRVVLSLAAVVFILSTPERSYQANEFMLFLLTTSDGNYDESDESDESVGLNRPELR
jgi:hypothetical protein